MGFSVFSLASFSLSWRVLVSGRKECRGKKLSFLFYSVVWVCFREFCVGWDIGFLSV